MAQLSTELDCLLRLAAALGGGALMGYERESAQKAAGLRTHAMVALGSCLFTYQALTAGTSDVGRAIQGIAAGVGFIGAGAILKNTAEEHVRGLTTAGSIWLTAAVGSAAGCGLYVPALLSSVVGFVVLRLFPLLGHKHGPEADAHGEHVGA
jgi:putative Mg2+ transporter-C (MgtC) family protein